MNGYIGFKRIMGVFENYNVLFLFFCQESYMMAISWNNIPYIGCSNKRRHHSHISNAF